MAKTVAEVLRVFQLAKEKQLATSTHKWDEQYFIARALHDVKSDDDELEDRVWELFAKARSGAIDRAIALAESADKESG